jgi:hypothetical protein
MEKRSEIEERLSLLSQMKKLSGFGPGLVEHYTNAKKNDAVTVLDEWVAAGKLSVRYLLRNPEHDTEKKIFANLEDIPFGEWYDEFQFGDEFQVDMDDIEKEYFFAEHQLTERPKPEPKVGPTHIDGVPIEIIEYMKVTQPLQRRIQEKQHKYGVTEVDPTSQLSYRFNGKEYTSAQVWNAYKKGLMEG